MDNKYILRCIELAKKAEKLDEIPVGAIIVKNNEIIGEGYNRRITTKSVISHAEVEAILAASKKINSWQLHDCDMYVTLKPCKMCENIIKQARISNVYYLIERLDYKKDYDKTNILKMNSQNDEENIYKEILTNFFIKKRGK